MDSELAALAASGATTLVSLLVTDSWTHARDLVREFFSRSGADVTAITDLDTARSQLLAAEATENTQNIRDLTEQWHTYLLQRLLQAGSTTGDDLRDLLTSLQPLATNPDLQPSTVHNDISGGVQHGPVIQSGRIAGLTFHVHHAPAPTQK
ncbi:hypothetical protein [Streptomyces sp. NBC_01171]|uniref:hypothetical protein n=1 Tax=Streptomyces sp. NBC_01171 TaxID=2903757 RepID=UPI003863E67E|nr:hypothetical protein OG448_30120 [Streptomyces sp. NBC_01171]